jgi:hypothetical protein
MMEISISQIAINKTDDPRVTSAFLASGKQRGHHAFSTHSVLPTRNKIMPNSLQRQKHSQARRSESTHINKSHEKSFQKYKKLDLTVNEMGSGSNLLKDYKRQTMRGKVRSSLHQYEQGLHAFYDRVEELEHAFVAYCHNSQFTHAAEGKIGSTQSSSSSSITQWISICPNSCYDP